MPRYTITEPHPSVAQNSYIHSGRGGSGNFMRAPLTTAPTGVPTPLPLAPTTSVSSASSSRSFYSGRGGAGNAHSALERPVLSFEDEYRRRESSSSSASRGHMVGRGGAGNFSAAVSGADVAKEFLGGGNKRRSSSSAGSAASDASGASQGWRNKFNGVFKH